MSCSVTFYIEQERTFQQAKEQAKQKVWKDILILNNEYKEESELYELLESDWIESYTEQLWHKQSLLYYIENNNEYAIWTNQPDCNGWNYYNPITNKFYVKTPHKYI